MDGRLTAYPPRVRAEQREILRLRPGWQRRLDRAGVDAVIVGARHPFAVLLDLDRRQWRRIAGDGERLLFERVGASDPEHATR
jgi:hypothetical protein